MISASGKLSEPAGAPRTPRFARTVRRYTGFEAVSALQPAGDGSCVGSGQFLLGRTMSRGYADLDMGAGWFRTRYDVRSIFVSRPNFQNTIRTDQPHRIQYLQIDWQAIRALDPAGEMPANGDFGAALEGTTHSVAINALLDRFMASLPESVDELAGATALSMVAEALADLSRARETGARDTIERLSLKATAIATDRLDCVSRPAPSLVELAALCHMSPSHFCRAFRASTGMPPHRYLMARRLENARHLLHRTDLPIAVIAAAVGYDDPAYFSRAFLRDTGVSPSAWRLLQA